MPLTIDLDTPLEGMSLEEAATIILSDALIGLGLVELPDTDDE